MKHPTMLWTKSGLEEPIRQARGVPILIRSVDGEAEEGGNDRMCIVTRARLSPDELIRFVADPDGEIVPDLKRRLPGRGVWVTATIELVGEAVKRQAFARGLKTTVRAPADLAVRVDRLLEQDALQSLAMANKAGLVVAGAAKVVAAIETGAIAGLVEANDGGADGARKLYQALTRRFGAAASKVPRIELFASSQLDLALGRTNVIHAALETGKASEAFLARCRRLAAYREPERGREAGWGETIGTVLQGLASECCSDREESTNGHGPGIENL
jgi:predicted RNA-binding protein YlxR (DUF448 family)